MGGTLHYLARLLTHGWLHRDNTYDCYLFGRDLSSLRHVGSINTMLFEMKQDQLDPGGSINIREI